MFTTHYSPLKCGKCNDVITCHVISLQLTVQCQQKKRAPHQMMRGSATTDGEFAYFTPYNSTSLYQYEYSTEKWTNLLQCPHRDSGLAIIDSELTTAGGRDDRFCPNNKLFTLRKRKWVMKYPPTNTPCSHLAVVSTSDGDYLIVIGGHDGDHWTAAVVLLQVKNRRWHKLTDLPQPLCKPSSTVRGDQLNVIGSDEKIGYSCSLQALPSSDRPITSPLTLSWKLLPCLPVTYSTAATLCGQLVIIGGWQYGSSVNFIHQLVDGEWVRIGSMASNRSDCLVASPSPDRIIVVGGYGAKDSVEECAVV